MELQKKILQDYREVFGQQTFREISTVTGIQQTRVFRLFNGSQMKLCEYEIFQQILRFRQTGRPEVFKLLKDCETRLSQQGLKEIENFLDQKIRLWKVVNIACSTPKKNVA
jgi:hypothetical protein